jgi:arginine repressor
VRTFAQWLTRKWQKPNEVVLAKAYQGFAASMDGQLLLQHWMDEIYCTVCPTDDALALARHNGKREFLNQILENIDIAMNPGKYEIKTEVKHG